MRIEGVDGRNRMTNATSQRGSSQLYRVPARDHTSIVLFKLAQRLSRAKKMD